ncbi:MAG TPA: T9SS type A sorting domain-containing protein [candidate division Zixibacteria bacterium]|nr:T9SS type A sorting domain-containing protein [candidate division Zixibacteria bacterium]
MEKLNQNYRTFYVLVSAILLFLNTTGKSESELDTLVHIFQQAAASRYFNQCKQPDTSFVVRIETQDGCAFPGDSVEAAVSINSPEYQIWGFDFLISYDSARLSLINVTPGSEFFSDSGCKWEYFSYRISANCGAQPCPTAIIRVVGLADVNNGAIHPNCWNAGKIADLFYMHFRVKNHVSYVFENTPIRFLWVECRNNAISYDHYVDIDGYQRFSIATAGRIFEGKNQLVRTDSFPTFNGPADSCFGDPENVFHYPIKSIIDFHNGGIQLVTTCPDYIDDRGDVDLNGLAYEINDFILFAKYFLYGTSVFTINIAGQIYATDVNKDDETLNLEDLVQLGRIVFDDLPEDWIFDSTLGGNNFVVNDESNGSVNFQTEQCANIIWLKFEGEVLPHYGNNQHFVLYHFDGEFTYVLAISLHGFGIGSRVLFDYSGQGLLTDTQAATLEGYEIALAPIGFSTDIDDTESLLPSQFHVRQNYPNPFNNSTVISFENPRASHVELEIINLLGQTVYRFEKRYSAGSHSISWDGIDNAGKTVGSGVYYYRIIAGDFVESKKMILLK